MGKRWIEAAELPEGEKVYLKKDILGWRVISPWKNEDNKINWFNFIFGGKRNLVTLIFLLILAALVFVGVNELISAYKVITSNPCDFCKNCISSVKPFIIK